MFAFAETPGLNGKARAAPTLGSSTSVGGAWKLSRMENLAFLLDRSTDTIAADSRFDVSVV